MPAIDPHDNRIISRFGRWLPAAVLGVAVTLAVGLLFIERETAIRVSPLTLVLFGLALALLTRRLQSLQQRLDPGPTTSSAAPQENKTHPGMNAELRSGDPISCDDQLPLQTRLLQEVGDVIVVTGSSSCITFWNHGAERFYGITTEQALGQYVDDIVNHRWPSAEEERAARAEMASSGCWQGLHIAVTDDGVEHYLESTCSSLHDDRGELMGTVTVSRDITERIRSEGALRQSEHRYKAIIDKLSDIIYTLSPSGAITTLSPSFEKVTGWSREEWIGRPFAQLVHPDDLPVATARLHLSLAGDALPAYELRIRARAGHFVSLEFKPTVLAANGRPTGILGVARDITARSAIQEQIRKLSRAVEQSPVSVVITDADGTIEYTNPRFTELTGYTANEVLGENPRILKSGNQPEEMYKELWETISVGGIWKGKLQNRKKNGDLYWEAVSISPITNEAGRISHFIAVKEDITDAVQTEKELRRLSAAVVQSANLVVVTDRDGLIEFVNPRFSHVTGFSPFEVIGKPLSYLKAPQPEDDIHAQLWEALRAGQTWRGTLHNRKKSGETYWERTTISSIYDNHGQVMNLLSMGEDITNELVTQQKLAERDKLSAIGVLAAGVAHEFKNYLGGIIGNASFALDELETSNGDGLNLARETLAQIIDMGERANDVAMSLLTYSKAKPEERVPTSLRQLAVNTINLVEKELKGRSIDIVTYFDEVPNIEVSSSKIQQLLLNLLINAEQAISANGIITIAVTRDEQWAYLRVGDTGVGIPSRNLPRIFDPFFSTKGVWGKDKLSGTGMGLAICRNIAREHGGELTVESTVDVGTTFTLRIPMGGPSPEIVPASKHEDQIRMLIFAIDKQIYKRYFPDACAAGVHIGTVDAIDKVDEEMLGQLDLLICDARFSGKVELFKVVERSRNHGISYCMVNCGQLEYQLAHLYDNATANFRDLPELIRLLQLLSSTGKPLAETT